MPTRHSASAPDFWRRYSGRNGIVTRTTAACNSRPLRATTTIANAFCDSASEHATGSSAPRADWMDVAGHDELYCNAPPRTSIHAGEPGGLKRSITRAPPQPYRPDHPRRQSPPATIGQAPARRAPKDHWSPTLGTIDVQLLLRPCRPLLHLLSEGRRKVINGVSWPTARPMTA